MTNRFRNQLMMSTLLVGVASLAAPVSAQTAPPAAQTPPADNATNASVAASEGNPNAETTTGDIVVTGSLIRNPNLTSASPVNVVNEGEITLRAPSTAEELLRNIPGVTPGIGSAVNNGANGFNFLDLRGLGVQRNLVLLDGNRLVSGSSTGAVDLNLIPLALIQRVDLLTGGASTTYGADAVTGVANFITRRDFTGIDARTTYKIPERGNGRTLRADLTIGANFAEDKGNAVIGLSYTTVDPIYQTRGFANFSISSTTGKASGSSFTSVPTTISFAVDNSQVSPSGASLIPQYQGFNFNPYNIFQTPIDRKSLYSAARYDVADGVEVYARGMFSNTIVQQIIAPSGIFGDELSVPANNPYLNATIRNQICAEDGIAPGACAGQTGTTTTTGLDLPGVYRRLVELGPRLSTFESNVYDARAGVRVDVSKSSKLDVNGSYGRSELTQTQSGYTLKSRIQQALNANNTTTCIDTSNNCVPLNLFGQAGSITPAQVAFIQGSSTIRTNTELKQARAVYSGDVGVTSPFASNPIGFGVGAEYREYTYQRIPDAFAQNPSELGGAGGAVLPFAGGYNVKEGFGELIAPLVSDRPWFSELTAEGGVRYSSYSVQAPGNPSFNSTTYKGGLTYQPVAGIKFRGEYQRAVRAPNIGELFAPVVTGLTNLTVDPCAGAAPTANPNLAAICRAQGAPAASIGTIQNPSAGQANETGGGNINLKPEKADTFTAGVVFTPRDYIPGLTLSADYFNIIINNAITFPTPGDAIAACFNNITAASATSPACTTIRRNAANGRLSGPASTVPGLPLGETNAGRLFTSGVDASFNYQRLIGGYGFNFNFVGNYTAHQKFQSGKASVNRECVGYYSANCGPSLGQIQPKFSFNQRTTLTVGPANFSLLWRYINPVNYEGSAGNYVQRGFTAVNRTLFSGTIVNAAGVNSAVAGRVVNFNHIPAYHYFDLTVQFDIQKQFQLTIGVQNLFDRDPPIVGAQSGTTGANSGNTFPSTYDAIGRSFAATVRVKL